MNFSGMNRGGPTSNVLILAHGIEHSLGQVYRAILQSPFVVPLCGKLDCVNAGLKFPHSELSLDPIKALTANNVGGYIRPKGATGERTQPCYHNLHATIVRTTIIQSHLRGWPMTRALSLKSL